MKYSVALLLVICSVSISVGSKHYGMRFSSVGSSLRCYKCSHYFGGRCENIQECSYEDSCLSLHEKGGKTIQQCIRYTDCDNSRLSQMFPAVSGFTYRCCNSNLCNGAAVAAALTWPLVLLLALHALSLA